MIVMKKENQSIFFTRSNFSLNLNFKEQMETVYLSISIFCKKLIIDRVTKLQTFHFAYLRITPKQCTVTNSNICFKQIDFIT